MNPGPSTLMAGKSFIQWNCRGFRANFNELKILAGRYNPLAFCLQETYFKPSDTPTLKNFCIYNSYGPDSNRASGGTSILIRQDIVHSNIPLNTNLQAIALRVTLHKTITLCSIYLQSNFTSLKLINLANQLPSPYIIIPSPYNARKKAERKLYRRPTAENLQIFKIKRARARQIIHAAKRQSWKDFVSGISSRTPMKKVWSMVRRIKGKGGDSRVQHLHVGTDVITTPAEIA